MRTHFFRRSVLFFFAVLLFSFLAGGSESAGYHFRGLTGAEQSEAAGWASYARAKYLLDSSDSADLPTIADYLVRSLMDLPDAREPFQLLLLLRGTRKDIAGLANDLSKIAKANPEHTFINLAYAEALFDSGQSAAGEAHLRAFLERTGWREGSAIIALLEAMQSREDWEGAGKILRKMLRRKELKDDFRLQIYRSEFILRLAQQAVSSSAPPDERQLAKAKTESQTILRQLLASPDSRTQWEFFLTLLPALGRLEMWEEFNSLLDNCSEEFQDTQLWYEQKLLALQKLAKKQELQDLTEKLLRLPELPYGLLERIALAYQELQDYSQAREIYEMLHFRNLPVLRYRLQLAWLYLLENKAKMGLAILTPVRELPFRGWLLQAALWRSMKESEKALQSYAQAEKAALAADSPEELDYSFYVRYALAAEDTGHIDQALDLFRKAYQLNPENPDVCNGLGYTLADHKRELPFAAELIDKAIEAEPENVAFLDSLAWIRFRQENFAGALEAMIKTLAKMQPEYDEDGVISRHAAEIFAANGLPIMADFFNLQADWNCLEQAQP